MALREGSKETIFEEPILTALCFLRVCMSVYFHLTII
jgi:hypothetical protein